MENLHRIPKKPRKKVKEPRVHHSREAKDKAARYYIIGLSLPEISKLLDGVPIRTLEKWQKSDKWTDLKNPVNIKNKVLQLFEAGKSRKQISVIIGRAECTVYRWIKEAKENDKKQ
jgi:hypothetical protein